MVYVLRLMKLLDILISSIYIIFLCFCSLWAWSLFFALFHLFFLCLMIWDVNGVVGRVSYVLRLWQTLCKHSILCFNCQLSMLTCWMLMWKVDSQMKSMPATAQVAAQQGEYLANCFNNMASEVHDNIAPEGPIRIRGKGRHRFHRFQYRHLGQFAPLGGEKAAYELPGDWVSIGRSTQWLWYSVYASKQVSWRTRTLVMFDWTKKFLFGRDSSKM